MNQILFQSFVERITNSEHTRWDIESLKITINNKFYSKPKTTQVGRHRICALDRQTNNNKTKMSAIPSKSHALKWSKLQQHEKYRTHFWENPNRARCGSVKFCLPPTTSDAGTWLKTIAISFVSRFGVGIPHRSHRHILLRDRLKQQTIVAVGSAGPSGRNLDGSSIIFHFSRTKFQFAMCVSKRSTMRLLGEVYWKFWLPSTIAARDYCWSSMTGTSQRHASTIARPHSMHWMKLHRAK